MMADLPPPTAPPETPALPGELGLVSFADFTSQAPFTFDNGQTISGYTLRYECYGHLNERRDNAILILHALSGDHHCAGVHSLKDRKPGWWNHMIGPGKPIDTNRFWVICINCLGGCQGSTGPRSVNPDTGQPYYLDFPLLTIADMVRAQHRLLREVFQIERLHAVVGGSMGGMQALQWAISYPEMVGRLLPLATSTRLSAQAIAFNEVGRLAILQDPGWQNGTYAEGKGPDVGLAVARMMAHITYLSDQGMEEKFGRERVTSTGARQLFEAEFQVESYLRYQGQSFIHRFDASTSLYFTKALDRFDLYGPSGQLEDTLQAVQARTLVVGFTSDWLFPPSQNRAIVHALLRCGADASYAELNLALGHDSFLLKSARLDALIHDFLGDPGSR